MALEISGAPDGLLDEPLALEARGAAGALWRARLRDDDGRIWRAAAARPQQLDAGWAPAKATAGPFAALGSLRHVRVDVRAEAADGRAAGRTLTRRLLGAGARARRWRDGVAGSLYLPAGAGEAGTALIDARADAGAAARAVLAGALLASRGALVLVVTGGDVERARERLAAVPGATAEVVSVDPLLPPGVPSTQDAAARAQAWDALLRELGARPRPPAG